MHNLSDVFRALFYLLYQKGVINSRELESLSALSTTPDKLVPILYDVAGGRSPYVPPTPEKYPGDDYI